MESMEVWCNTNNVKIATVGGFRSSGGQCWDLQFPWASKKEMPGSVPAKPHQQQSPGARLPEYPAGGLETPQQSASTAARPPGFGDPHPSPRKTQRPARPPPSQPSAPRPRQAECRNSVSAPPPLKTFWEGVSETCFERGFKKINVRFFAFKKKSVSRQVRGRFAERPESLVTLIF